MSGEGGGRGVRSADVAGGGRGMITVAALSTTPVKGTRLHRVESIELTRNGSRGDRRFLVIDDRDRMLNAKRLGELQQVVADVVDGRLRLTFPDGSVVEEVVATDGQLTARFYSATLDGRVLKGPWADALSTHLGEPVRVLEAATSAIDRGREGAASLISRASLAAIAEAGGQSAVDSRRFRMLFEIDGVDAHAEDRWVGQEVRIGEATIRFNGHVGRCLITSRHPESGRIDLPTLDIIGGYRRELDTTEPLPFGIYGEVVTEGTVRVGDAVSAG